MIEDARQGRLGGVLARSIRAALRPGVLMLALLVAFLGGRWSVRHSRAQGIDTPAIRDAAELERSLVDLEANLELGQSLVAHQTELKRRHERVSALACAAANGQQADSKRLAEAKTRRAHQVAHLSTDEDHEETDSMAPAAVTSPPIAARRTGAR